MKHSELLKLSDEKLNVKLSELSNEIVDKRIAIYNNSLNDTSTINKTKKTIARIKTILVERKQNGEVK